MKKEYFVLTCFNGDPIVESYTKEKLLEDLNEDAWGPSINILDKLPDSPNKRLMNSYLNRLEKDSDIEDSLFNALYENDNIIAPPKVPKYKSNV